MYLIINWVHCIIELVMLNFITELIGICCITGCDVTVPPEVIVLNSIVLPYKDLSHSYKNEIIL